MSEETPPERVPWWREWPLALAVVTFIAAMLGKNWTTSALDQPAMLVLLTLMTSILTFSLPRTKVLLGFVHLLLFCSYFMPMSDR